MAQDAKMEKNDIGTFDNQVENASIELVIECPASTTDAKLAWKTDRHVMPILFAMYTMAYLDRVNIGNANVFGLSEDLGLTGTQYNVALVIFFIPYCLLEIPSNILLKKFRPALWLAMNMAGFGLVTLLQGFVKGYGGLLATRFFLGVFETGMFPGCLYIIGMWYRRDQAQKRFTFFYNGNSLAGAFGGLLAAAIGSMDGVANYRGWRWIFIIEGGATILLAVLFYFLLPEFPEEAKWLKGDEKTYIMGRLRAEQGASSHETTMSWFDIKGMFTDIKTYASGFMYMGLVVVGYAYSFFAPTIIKTYGYNNIQTQLHSVPPWASACVASMTIAFLSDKFRHRFGFAVFGCLISIIGFSILVAIFDNHNVQYGGLFMIISGAYVALPIILCWFNMNLGGHQRRAIGSAWQIGFGNIGGIMASFAFVKTDGPRYIRGYSICYGFSVLTMVSCIVYASACYLRNKRRDREAAAGNEQGFTQEEKDRMGDLSPDYRYLL